MTPMGVPMVSTRPLGPPRVPLLTPCPHGPSGCPHRPPTSPWSQWVSSRSRCHQPFPRIPAVLQSWSIQQDGPISTVLLFPLEEPDDDGDVAGGHRGADDVGPSAPGPEPTPHYSLLVASTIEMSVVYR